MPRLLIKKRAEITAEYKINNLRIINIGSIRANDVFLPDKNISENHCTITKVSDTYEIKDNNTLTGTTLNKKSITISELKYNDEIGIGNYTIIFLKDALNIMREIEEEDYSLDESKGKNYFLLGIYGRFEGKKYHIKNSGTFIGREKISPKGIENDVILAGDMTVSKGHAKIVLRENLYFLKDIGSTGGVAINGKKVGQLNEIQIRNGDEIAIGRTIFRFAEDGNDDYSLPKNHEIFLLKARGPFIRFIVVSSLIISFMLGYSGIVGIKISQSTVRKISFDLETAWNPSGNPLRNLPKEYDISGSMAIGDLNSDGTNDIVFLSPSGFLYAWDGKKGNQIFKPVEIYNSGKSSPVLYDMNNDGILDIVVVSDTSLLYLIDGKSGGIIRKEVLGGAISELSPAIADLDGDGKQDVVVCAEDGMVHFIYDPGFDADFQKYTEFVEGPIYASPVILSTDKISPLVVVCCYNSKVFFFDGKNRSKKTVDIVEKTGKVHLLSSPPAVGDLNGDEIPEVVVLSNTPQYVSAIDITSFGVNWTYFVEPVPPSGIKHNSPPVIADINGNGTSYVVFVSPNGYLYALKGKTGYPAGELLYKTKIPDGGRLIGGLSLYDFYKNGSVGVAFGTEEGDVVIARSQPHARDWEIATAIKISNDPITSTLMIGDINGDSKIEILCSNFANSIQMLKSNLRTFKNKLIWPVYLGGPLRTGSSDLRENKTPYIIKLCLGVLIFLALMILYFIHRNKQYSKRYRTFYL